MPSAKFSSAALLLVAVAACGSETSEPDLGFLVQANGTPPASAAIGSNVPIAVKILHRESGGGTTPAAGIAVTFTVNGGGGVVNGTGSVTLPTGTDGTVSATWALGTLLGPQTMRVSLSIAVYLDITIVGTQASAGQISYLNLTPSVLVQHPQDLSPPRYRPIYHPDPGPT